MSTHDENGFHDWPTPADIKHHIEIVIYERMSLMPAEVITKAVECVEAGMDRAQKAYEEERRHAREAAAEEAYERHQRRLMETGGPDDSSYRQQMIDAGRGHLLK